MARAGGFEISESQIVNEPDPAAATRQAIALVREGRAGLLMKGKIATASLIRAVLDKDTGLRTNRQLSQVVVFSGAGLRPPDARHQRGHQHRAHTGRKGGPLPQCHRSGARNRYRKAEYRSAVRPGICQSRDARHHRCRRSLRYESPRPDFRAATSKALSHWMPRSAGLRRTVRTSQSPVVEATDIFLAPDIEAANILYRAIVYFAKAESGGIVLGARVPLVLLSRAETAETKVRSIAIGVLCTPVSGG